MESHETDTPAPTPEGQLIRRVRDAAIPKLSIRAAAERVGMSAENWGYVERGYRPARNGQPAEPFGTVAGTLARMAHALGISPERLAAEGQRPDAAEMLREMRPREEGIRVVPDQGDFRRIRPFIPYEVPLGDGESARLVLPQDLTGEEAGRLCGVIRSLAFAKPAG